MPETDALTSTNPNQLPPRTTNSHRWPRKWSTLGGRGSTLPPQVHLNETEKMNGNGHGHGHRHTTSLFRKSSTISRTNGAVLNTENSLTKSRSLINVLRSKLNSPAVLRRFRTKSRESSKQVVTEIQETDEKKTRKRDPSPMKRFTSRLAQLTRSSTHTSIESSTQRQKSPSPTSSPSTTQQQDQVDHINACYDEIRAKYFDKNNNSTATKQSSTLAALSQHPCAPLATDRLKDMLSTTTTSSVDYYDRPNGDIHNRSLSTISMNGSLLSHDFLNNSQVLSTSPPKATIDDPALQARKQSNIKLNCMLSGYGFKTPFGNLDKTDGEHDIFKFHHYHDVGKRKFDWNMTSESNRLYSSLRTRPMSRSIDNFRRATTTIENEKTSTDEPSETTDELVIREDSDMLTCSSKIHVQPAVSLQVKTFISSTSNDNHVVNEDFEKNFLRAVDRALGVSTKDTQPLYDTPMKIEPSDINLVELTERALSNFKNTEFLTNGERKEEQNDDEQQTNGTESPNVELFDRTGELLNTDNIQWQTSAVYDQQEESNPIVCSVVDDLTCKTQDLIYDEPQVSSVNN